jgi:hypothetical protein
MERQICQCESSTFSLESAKSKHIWRKMGQSHLNGWSPPLLIPSCPPQWLGHISTPKAGLLNFGLHLAPLQTEHKAHTEVMGAPPLAHWPMKNEKGGLVLCYVRSHGRLLLKERYILIQREELSI